MSHIVYLSLHKTQSTKYSLSYFHDFISTGPILWYQEFEYAIGHWLQKATEHVFGCVLCAPGCFSLFRGAAVMDDNVARSYAIRTTEAGQYVQYDQGMSKVPLQKI